MSAKRDTVAVDNFLASLSGDSRADFENARADARSYGWNSATLEAVINGIAAHYSRRAS